MLIDTNIEKIRVQKAKLTKKHPEIKVFMHENSFAASNPVEAEANE